MESPQIIKQENFGAFVIDFRQDANGNFWVTREQVGRALEYEFPEQALFKIHERHKDRLDKFSTLVNLTTVEGKREVTREIIVYSPQGVYEICRWSRQPKADEFQDFVYQILESLRTGAGKPESLSGDKAKVGEIILTKAEGLKDKLIPMDLRAMVAKGLEMLTGEPVLHSPLQGLPTSSQPYLLSAGSQVLITIQNDFLSSEKLHKGDAVLVNFIQAYKTGDLVYVEFPGGSGVYKFQTSNPDYLTRLEDDRKVHHFETRNLLKIGKVTEIRRTCR